MQRRAGIAVQTLAPPGNLTFPEQSTISLTINSWPPVTPVNNGVPANVAMSALMDVEEEGWRAALDDADTTAEERARITARLE